MKEYQPGETDKRFIEHVKAAKLNPMELSHLCVAINRRREHHATQLFAGFELNEPSHIRWARRRLASLEWMMEEVGKIHLATINKIPVKRNPGPERYFVSEQDHADREADRRALRHKGMTAGFERLYGKKKSSKTPAEKSLDSLHRHLKRERSPKKKPLPPSPAREFNRS